VPERLDRLILLMALALYGCVRCGREDAFQAPTPTEKSPAADRSRPLERAQGLPLGCVLVHTRIEKVALLDPAESLLAPIFYAG
jgi:hypothetical protein